MFKQRPNRRKQNISALSADPDSLSSSSQLPKRRWMQPSSSDEFGICATTDGGGGDAFVVDKDDLEDDDLRFKGFSYTYNTPGDAKSLLDYFACPKCPAIFDSRVGLTNHSKLHGGQLPLQCEHCDFSCTNQKTLRFHRRAHGVMPRRGRPTPPRSTAADALGKKHRLTAEPPPPPPSIGGENADKNMDRRGGDDGVRAKNNIKKHGEEVPLEEEEENFIIINAKKSCGEEAYSAGGDSVKFGPPPLLARATINRAGFEEEDDEEEANFDHQQQPLPSTSKASRRPSSTTTNNARAASRTSKQQKGDGGNVQCAMCPFSTPSRVRLQSHMDGHYRTTGFVCSVCEYKHESMGWLHLHCTSLHLRKEGVPFQWPPAYVKEGGGELLEKTSATPRGERKGR